MRAIFCLFALLSTSSLFAGHLTSGTWTLDPKRTLVAFSVVKHGTERVDGRFRDFKGTITYDEANPARSSIEWRVRIASVQTGEPGRDRTLQSDDYFDVARHPEMVFRARGVQRLRDGSMRFDGTITIRGVSKPLTVVAKQIRCDPNGPIFSTQFDLDRFDFGVKGGLMMRPLISRKVNVRLLAVGAPK